MAPRVRDQDTSKGIRRRESLMFMILFVVLLVAWLLGWFTLHAAGGLIHLLLVVAVIFLVVHFVRGRA
jgi:Flp pilus assembly protein TadB